MRINHNFIEQSMPYFDRDLNLLSLHVLEPPFSYTDLCWSGYAASVPDASASTIDGNSQLGSIKSSTSTACSHRSMEVGTQASTSSLRTPSTPLTPFYTISFVIWTGLLKIGEKYLKSRSGRHARNEARRDASFRHLLLLLIGSGKNNQLAVTNLNSMKCGRESH